MLAAQIEETVFEPDVLRVILFAEYRHRQFGGRTEYLDLVDIDFDLAGRQVGVEGALGPPPHLAIDSHHPFRAQRLGKLERRTVGVGYNLRDAVVVTQIDEQDAAVVADAVAPAREAHRFTDIALAKRGAGV